MLRTMSRHLPKRKSHSDVIALFGRNHPSEATVIELSKDLQDLRIDPAALFNFGHLQPDA